MKIEIYTDGAAMPNPGELGYAAVLVAMDDDGTVLKRITRSGYKKHGTNNQAEILAAIIGLQALQKPSTVTVYSDSQYLVKVASGEWNSNKNGDDFRVLRTVMQEHDVTWQWVRGHNGNPHNEMAHDAANRALANRGQP